MTYNVFGGTLYTPYSINQPSIPDSGWPGTTRGGNGHWKKSPKIDLMGTLGQQVTLNTGPSDLVIQARGFLFLSVDR